MCGGDFSSFYQVNTIFSTTMPTFKSLGTTSQISKDDTRWLLYRNNSINNTRINTNKLCVLWKKFSVFKLKMYGEKQPLQLRFKTSDESSSTANSMEESVLRRFGIWVFWKCSPSLILQWFCYPPLKTIMKSWFSSPSGDTYPVRQVIRIWVPPTLFLSLSTGN